MPLQSLPTELIEHITDHLDVDSFRSFRLASPSLNQQSLHQFKQRFFRRRTVVWTSESLDRLVRVTSDPYFGRSLRDLIVDATPRFAIRLWELEKGIIEADLQQDQARHEDIQAQYREVEGKCEEVTKFWNETRHDRRTLVTIFERLGRLRSIIFAYDGMKKNFLLFGRRYCESSQNEMSRPFVSTMAAIAVSDLKVQTITIDGGRRYGAVSAGRLESVSPLLSRFGSTFAGLEVLKLNIRDWRSPDEGFEMSVDRAPFLVRFMSQMKNLRVLDLSCFSSLEENMLSEMAKHCTYPRLESCRLVLFQIRKADDLFRFLSPSKSSLRSLSLSHTVLRERGSEWSFVMDRIASEFNLRHLELTDLFTRLGARVGFDGTMRRTLELGGPRVSRELKERAGAVVSGNWGPAWHLAAVAYPFIGLHT